MSLIFFASIVEDDRTRGIIGMTKINSFKCTYEVSGNFLYSRRQKALT